LVAETFAVPSQNISKADQSFIASHSSKIKELYCIGLLVFADSYSRIPYINKTFPCFPLSKKRI
jgi:hypothetical protein